MAELRLNGDLSQAKFEPRLQEKLVLKTELHAVAVISKAIAEKAPGPVKLK